MRLRIQQSIESEEGFPQDELGQQDFMLDRLNELVEDNLVDPVEAEEVFRDWYNRHNPMVVVKFLGSTVSKPFYE